MLKIKGHSILNLFWGVCRRVPSASGSCVLKPEMETKKHFMHQSMPDTEQCTMLLIQN